MAKKRIKITESQYRRLFEKLEDENSVIDIPPIIKKVRNIPQGRKSDLPNIIDDIPEPIEPETKEPLTQEEIQDKKIEKLTNKVDFLESFFRDLIDFQEVATNHINKALKEISKGEIGILEVVEKLNRLTVRKGRSSFFIAKRGLT